MLVQNVPTASTVPYCRGLFKAAKTHWVCFDFSSTAEDFATMKKKEKIKCYLIAYSLHLMPCRLSIFYFFLSFRCFKLRMFFKAPNMAVWLNHHHSQTGLRPPSFFCQAMCMLQHSPMIKLLLLFRSRLLFVLNLFPSSGVL